MTATTADAPPPELRLPKRRGVELALLVGGVLISVSGYAAVGLARMRRRASRRRRVRSRARHARPARPCRGPLPGPVRRSAAAADRRPAQRARPGADLPARPGDPEGPGRAHPARLVHARRRAVRRRGGAAARPPGAPAVRVSLGGLGARAADRADLLPGGERGEDLDPGRRTLLPARRVRQDPARGVLRRLSGRQPQRARVHRPHLLEAATALRPGARADRGDLAAERRGAGAGARSGHLAAVLRALRHHAVRGDRPDRLDRGRPAPGRRRGLRRRLLRTARPQPGAGLAGPVRLDRRGPGAGPARPVAVRLRRRMGCSGPGSARATPS